MEEHPSCYVEGCFTAPNFSRVFPLWSQNPWNLSWCVMQRKIQRRSAFFDVVMGRTSYQQLTHLLNLTWDGFQPFLFCNSDPFKRGNPSECVMIVFNAWLFLFKVGTPALGGADHGKSLRFWIASLSCWTLRIIQSMFGMRFWFRQLWLNSEIIVIVTVKVSYCSNDLVDKLQWLYDKQEFSRWRSSWWYNSCSMTPFDLASETATLQTLHSAGPFMGMHKHLQNHKTNLLQKIHGKTWGNTKLVAFQLCIKRVPFSNFIRFCCQEFQRFDNSDTRRWRTKSGDDFYRSMLMEQKLHT